MLEWCCGVDSQHTCASLATAVLKVKKARDGEDVRTTQRLIHVNMDCRIYENSNNFSLVSVYSVLKAITLFLICRPEKFSFISAISVRLRDVTSQFVLELAWGCNVLTQIMLA